MKIYLILLFLLLIFFFWPRTTKDGFKVLGSLAPQKQMYWKCLSDCERGDPNFQMTKTKGSMSCLEYCDSTITDLVRRGGPSYPLDINAATVPIVTHIDQAYSRCGDGTKGAFCRKNFTSDVQIDEKCRQNCAYSPSSTCMEDCTKSLGPNKSTGWSWK